MEGGCSVCLEGGYSVSVELRDDSAEGGCRVCLETGYSVSVELLLQV